MYSPFGVCCTCLGGDCIFQLSIFRRFQSQCEYDSKSSQQYASSTVTQQLRTGSGVLSTLDSLRQGLDEPAEPAQSSQTENSWLWLAALAVLLLAGVIVWREFTRQLHKQRMQNLKTPPATPFVVAAEARQGDIPVYFTGLGAVTSIYTVTIKTRVDGQINKRFLAPKVRRSKKASLWWILIPARMRCSLYKPRASLHEGPRQHWRMPGLICKDIRPCWRKMPWPSRYTPPKRPPWPMDEGKRKNRRGQHCQRQAKHCLLVTSMRR